MKGKLPIVLAFLKKKHYRPKNLYNHKKSATFIFIATFCLIFLFPFDSIHFVHSFNQIFISLCYATLATLAYLLNNAIFKPSKSASWLYLNEIFLHISIILSIFLFINIFSYLLLEPCFIYLLNSDEHFSYTKHFFVWSLIYCVTFGIIFYALINFFDLVNYLVNKKTLNIDFKETTSEILDIKGKNKNERLVIPFKDLVFIKSEGHYINIHYLQQDKLQLNNTIFRSSMNEIEKHLKSHTSIVRCHKSYFINIVHIRYINSFQKKFFIVLKDFNQRIPVNSDKAEIIQSLLDEQ